VERLRRVMQLWDWLPAFRAIAEAEHLTNAAHRLHLTPPALSRTLKILEEDLGRPLFEREGRNLVLNPAGRRLLVAVRAAMRLVHDAVLEVEEGATLPLIIASAGIFTVVGLEDTLIRMLDSHPQVRPKVSTSASADPAADLLQGRIDLLFTSAPPSLSGLSQTALGRSPMAVCCGPSHPLYGRTDVELDEVVRYPFVAPPLDPTGNPVDGWPGDWPRQVVVSVDRQALGLSLCRSGRALAVLPLMARAVHPELWRLPLAVPGEVGVWAVHRRPVGESGPVEAAVAHAQAVMDAAVGSIVQVP
jgi:DNA-binding transcriptional LysR family regulator